MTKTSALRGHHGPSDATGGGPTIGKGDAARDALIGGALAVAIVVSAVSLHVYGVFLLEWSVLTAAAAPLIVAVQCWLYVGLFIVAHDCMHGTFAPGRDRLNRLVGSLCVALYAGFDYSKLTAKHHQHHRYSGTLKDPDFHGGGSDRFWPWFARFFRQYFSWREFAPLAIAFAIYLLLFEAPIGNMVLFWALPSILSSMQLFYFGTFLPHRPKGSAFADSHRARSSRFGRLASLLTCFHFGYHYEHHLHPYLPWWRLPRAHRALQPVD